MQSTAQKMACERFSDLLMGGWDISTKRPRVASGGALLSVVVGHSPGGGTVRLGAYIRAQSGNMFWVRYR